MDRQYEPEPQDGDQIPRTCEHCRTDYEYIVGEGDRKLCPDCADTFDDLDRVGGSLRIRDDDERERVRALLETEYGVWEHERLGELYIYREDDTAETA